MKKAAEIAQEISVAVDVLENPPPVPGESITGNDADNAGEARVLDGTAHVTAEAHVPPQDEAAFALSPESIIEAVLLATDVPLPGGKLAQIVGGCDAKDVQRHVETLNARYEQMGCSFRIELIAKGYQLLTLPVYNPWISKLHKARADARLSGPALETLAVIAYKQPVMRAEIEAVRGVAVGEVLGRLREANLVKIVGRAEEIGRPLLYGTTTRFLDVFGLASIKDLPKIDPDRPDEVPTLRVVSEAGEEL